MFNSLEVGPRWTRGEAARPDLEAPGNRRQVDSPAFRIRQEGLVSGAVGIPLPQTVERYAS